MADKINLENATLDLAQGKFLIGSKFDFGTHGSYTLQSNSSATPNINGNYLSYKDGELIFTGSGGEWNFVDPIKTAGGGTATETTLKNITLTGAASVAVGSGANVKLSDGNDTVGGMGRGGAQGLYGAVTIDLGGGNDFVRTDGGVGSSINLGAGDDTIQGDGGSNVTVTLGDGADVIDVEKPGTITITDYNYKEDKILMNWGKGILDKNGQLKSLEVQDAIYNIGKAGEKVHVAKLFAAAEPSKFTYYATTADDAGDIAIDFTGATSSDTLELNVSTANSADIHLGDAVNSTVSLKADNGVDTLTFGHAGSMATVLDFNTQGNNADRINIEGVAFSEMELSSSGADSINFKVDGKDTLVLAGSGIDTTALGTLGLNDKKVIFDLAGNHEINDTDGDQFYGVANSTTLNVSKSHLLTENAGDYKNINVLNLAAAGAGVEGLRFEGSAADDTINVSASTAGVVVEGGAGADSIKLGGVGSDTLRFGAGNTSGKKDTVADFAYGMGDSADWLHLYDTKNLADMKFDGSVANSLVVTASDGGTAEIGLKAASADEKSDIVKVKLADDSEHKVITGLKDNAGYINLYASDQNSCDFFAFDGSAGSTINLTGEAGDSTYLDTRVKEAYTGKLNGVDGSKNLGDMDIAGVADVGFGKGKNNFYAAGVDSKITLYKDAGTNEFGGTDTVWFDSSEKAKITVENFDVSTDKIWIQDATDLNSIIAGYDFGFDAGNAVIKGKTGSITLIGANTDVTNKAITIQAGSDTANLYKALIHDGAAEFAVDVDIYSGMQELQALADIKDTEIRVGLGKQASEIMKNAYGAAEATDSLVDFDGSKSKATMLIRGSSKAASRIAGGLTANAMYGGSSHDDEMTGGGVDAIDTFWYGSGEGNDLIKQVDNGDIVYLWNVGSDDLGTVSITSTEIDTKLAIGGSALTIADDGTFYNGGVTLVTSDFKNYVYSKESGSLVEKA